MFRDDAARVGHMLEAAREALAFIVGRSRCDLDHDRMLSLALVRLLEVLGEAASGVTNEFRSAQPQIPWTQIIGMRNRLIDGYFDVNLDVVWKTVHDDLPSLVAKLERIK
jgi:uncharacterized protein with HEPN domain